MLWKQKTQQRGYSFEYTVLRHRISFSAKALEHICQQYLCGITQYKRTSLEDAPKQTDCVTSIYFLFKTYFNHYLARAPLYPFFHPYYIGDMPRMLTKVHSWEMVKTSSLLPGDLLFVSESTKVSHLAVVITPNQIFHCSKKTATAQIVPCTIFFQQHSQPKDITNSRDRRKSKLLDAIRARREVDPHSCDD